MDKQTKPQNLPAPNHGFTVIELMIVVAVIGIIAAIAIPIYRDYITTAKQESARAVLETFPVLVEQHRAETGWMSPTNAGLNPVVNAVHTFVYQENNDGTVSTDTITPNFRGFRAKSPTQTDAVIYHYQLEITTTGCPACRESAVATAIPQTNRGAPADNIVTDPFD